MIQIINFLAGNIVGKIYLAFVIIASIGQIAFLVNILVDRFLQIHKAKQEAEVSLEEGTVEASLNKDVKDIGPKLVRKKPEKVDLDLESTEEYNLVDYLHTIDPDSIDDAVDTRQLPDEIVPKEKNFPPPTNASHNLVINDDNNEEEEEDDLA